MQRLLLSAMTVLLMTGMSLAQTTILDFESPETSTTFQYFGSSLDGSLNEIIANPNPTGINTSAMVAEHIKPAGSQVWAGAFSNPNPSIPVDLTNAGQVCVKVHTAQAGNVMLKFENSTNGYANWELPVDVTEVNQWTEVCFDVTLPSAVDPFEPAAGGIYSTVTIFFDFGTSPEEDRTYYFDDIVVHPMEVMCSTVLDFEDDTTSTNFQYFGSSLDGSLTEVIVNPNPSGINTSDSVTRYEKPGDAMTWAGAFSNPNPQVQVDLVTYNQVCMKVHMDHIGNVLLKLEQSTTGGANWEQLAQNTVVNEWEELCFDVTLPSTADPFMPAAGHVYERITLFFDFGQTGADTVATSYFDDIIMCSAAGPTDADVTFTVDMNEYSEAFDTVYVSGSFNSWSGDANPLDDSDGDGIWTTTLNLPIGLHEFKYTLDNWAVQEEFMGAEDCVITDPSGQFVNRQLLVTDNGGGLDTVCWNSCYGCGESILITVNLGTSHITPDTTGMYVAGGGTFGIPGDFPMTETAPDVWTITFEKPLGFSSYYTFTNGACPDYSCKENIAGQDCANPDNFNDRFMGPFDSDTTINTCFALCTEDLDCSGAAQDGLIKFRVDMNEYSGSFTQVYVSGSFNGWSGEANPMDDSDGDNVWETEIMLSGGTYEYKFTLDNWTVQEEFQGGEPCIISDPSGQFHNRLLEVDGDAELEDVCFNSCQECETSSVGDLKIRHDLFTVIPNITSDQVVVQFNEQSSDDYVIRVVSASGQTITRMQIAGSTAQQTLDVTGLSTGLYMISVTTERTIATQRFIKN